MLAMGTAAWSVLFGVAGVVLIGIVIGIYVRSRRSSGQEST